MDVPDECSAPTRVLRHADRSVPGPGRIRLRQMRRSVVSERRLEVDGRPLIDLGLNCDTCDLTLNSLGSLSGSVLGGFRDRLAHGITDLDPAVLEVVEDALPAGEYAALLLEVRPTGPAVLLGGEPGTEDEVDSPVLGYAAGVPFPAPWRLHDPDYEDFHARGIATAPPVTWPVVVREVIVPLVDPGGLDPDTLRSYAAELAGGARCTAVAWSVFERVTADEVALVHHLLDGHHRMHAAATGRHAVGLLSLLSLSAGTLPEDRARQLVRELRRNG